MYSRFGMTHVAIQAAQARARAAELQQHHDATPHARAAVLATHDDKKGALWRMAAVVAVIVAVVGTIAWFTA